MYQALENEGKKGDCSTTQEGGHSKVEMVCRVERGK